MFTDADLDLLLSRERRRTEALVRRDFAALNDILDDLLVYTHSTGIVHDKAGYLDYVGGPLRFLSVERSGLRVRWLDGAALMTGQMKSVMQPPAQAASVTIRTNVQQVWAYADGAWKLLAFQATRITP